MAEVDVVMPDKVSTTSDLSNKHNLDLVIN